MKSFDVSDICGIGLSELSAVALPGAELYERHIRRWSQAAQKSASLIILPANTEDVSKSILFCNKHGLEFAVCGGGHSTSGSSSVDGGVAIDLCRMKQVSVDPETKTITVGGGALWKDVDSEAEKCGLAAVGGTVNHTGVGGLTLGGGYGYLTPAHGLAIDDLISVDYVLADGKIVTASDIENQDLFWAARGAGASFGIATSFVYRAHDQKGPVWAAMLRLDSHHLPAMVEYGNQFLEICEEKSMMFTGFVKIPGFGNGPSLMSILFYNGPEDAAKSFYADVLKLDSTVLKMGEVPFSAMNTYLNDSMAHDLRRSVKGSVYMPPMELSSIETIYRELNEFALEYQDASMSGVLIEYIPFKNVIKVPQTATAFANRGAYANVAFVMTWTKEELDDICRGKARLWASRLQEEFQKARSAVVDAGGLDSVTQDGIGEYMNYDGLGSHGDKMFGINYPRLKELKLRYDPQNRFNKGPQLI